MAAVMRAMNMSVGIGNSGAKGHYHHGGDYHLDGSGHGVIEELQPPGSYLQPPNPAFVFGSPTGILINASRPYSVSSAASSSASLSQTSSNSHAPLPSPRTPQRQGTQDTYRPSQPVRNDSEPDRGRSRSREHPAHTGSRKIRFAPLPEIPTRPRSYSTGRNVWLEEEDVTDGLRMDGDESRGFVRREHRHHSEGESDEKGSISDDDDEEDASPARSGVFGSWSSGSAFGSKKDDSSMSKILRPFGMGRSKKGKRGSIVGSLTGSDADYLSRTESNDSSMSRGSERSSAGHGSFNITRPSGGGVPMRKTRTWELGEGGHERNERAHRRANYPPVAQRSRNRRFKGSVDTGPDPKFVEWGNVASTGSKKGDDDEIGRAHV